MFALDIALTHIDAALQAGADLQAISERSADSSTISPKALAGFTVQAAVKGSDSESAGISTMYLAVEREQYRTVEKALLNTADNENQATTKTGFGILTGFKRRATAARTALSSSEGVARE